MSNQYASTPKIFESHPDKVNRFKNFDDVTRYSAGSNIYVEGVCQNPDCNAHFERQIYRIISGDSWCKDCAYKLKNRKNLIWNDYVEQIFVGNMLGDGTLSKPLGNTNSRFCLSQSATNNFGISKKAYIEFIAKAFGDNITIIDERKRKKPCIFNGKISHALEHWDNSYVYSFELRTCQHPFFTEKYKLWYQKMGGKNVKIVPKNIKITWLTAAIWYCDDGHLNKNARELIICTHGFSQSCVEFLMQKLKEDLNITAFLASNKKGQFYIRIAHDQAESFIKGVSPFVTFECFNYKLQIKSACEQKSLHRVKEKGYENITWMKNGSFKVQSPILIDGCRRFVAQVNSIEEAKLIVDAMNLELASGSFNLEKVRRKYSKRHKNREVGYERIVVERDGTRFRVYSLLTSGGKRKHLTYADSYEKAKKIIDLQRHEIERGTYDLENFKLIIKNI